MLITAFSTGFPQAFINHWKKQVDLTWPDNLSTEEKLVVFDKIWSSIDAEFAQFQGLNIDWDSIREKYRPEIENGVSRGRFVSIMNHLALLLQESHTFFSDSLVNWGTTPEPGIPLAYVGGWGNNSHFGAGLTPLPDSSLLVYQVVTDHPLGIEVGDIILGYNGIPWKNLYKQIIQSELPVGKFRNGLFEWGTNNKAFTHSWLMSAGLNWHLFDEIDIVKYQSTDTVHLATDLLKDRTMEIYCTEQLEVDDIPFPDLAHGKFMSWGILKSYKIGYINIWKWYSTAEFDMSSEFALAMQTLTSNNELAGIIIDHRYNTGGTFHYLRGLNEIFYNPSVFIAFLERINPKEHEHLRGFICTGGISYQNIRSKYDKPIAILTGPGAISAADFFVRILKFYPKAKTFGKSTSSAFGSPVWIELDAQGWGAKYSFMNYAFVGDEFFGGKEIDTQKDSVDLLARSILAVDENVWLTPTDVREGKDTVLGAAISWILNQAATVQNEKNTIVSNCELYQNYPNPFNTNTAIQFSLFKSMVIELEIYNIKGEWVKTLVLDRLPAGNHVVNWSPENCATGLYFTIIKTEKQTLTTKMLYIK